MCVEELYTHALTNSQMGVLAQSLAVLCEYMLLIRVPAQRDVLT